MPTTKPTDDTTDEATNPNNVINFKTMYEAAQQRVAALEAANSALLARAEAAETEARFHPLTELANQRLFDRELSVHVSIYIQCEPAIKLINGEHPARLSAAELQEIAFTVAMIDLSYLTLLNNLGGHSLGNRALISLADAFRSTITKFPAGLATAYHWGGDEFALICCRDAKTADEILQEAAKQYRNCVLYPDPTLRPSADFGAAMLVEALWVYGYFVKNYPHFAPADPRDQLTCIMEFLRAVADERALQNKIVDRFLLLADLFADGHGMYDTYFPHLTRCSSLLTRERIEEAAHLPVGIHRNRYIHTVVNTNLKDQLDTTLKQVNTCKNDFGVEAIKRHLTLRMAIRRWRFDTPIR